MFLKVYGILNEVPNGLRYPLRSTLMRAGGWDEATPL
jgi:hypothetical protein